VPTAAFQFCALKFAAPWALRSTTKQTPPYTRIRFFFESKAYSTHLEIALINTHLRRNQHVNQLLVNSRLSQAATNIWAGSTEARPWPSRGVTEVSYGNTLADCQPIAFEPWLSHSGTRTDNRASFIQTKVDSLPFPTLGKKLRTNFQAKVGGCTLPQLWARS